MLRQDPSLIGAESHKMLPVINLKMRKLPSVESLCHKVHVGTAALGCPRSVALLWFGKWGSEKKQASKLARTAEGGCPHMILVSEYSQPCRS
jgi:hypothetical protein